MNGKREYGDYQTPIEFAERVCNYLCEYHHIKPSAIIEPTCGLGTFLQSSLIFNAKEYYGIEINPKYCAECQKNINDDRVRIINSDFFSFSSKALVKDKRQILVIGNPPWVTNSALSVQGPENLPVKANFKELRGIDAITGSSNFDICEYIILQLINEYRDTDTVISMLCKTSVARNIFRELKRSCISFEFCDVLEFDAAKVFGINTSACVLVIQLSRKQKTNDYCNVYDFEAPDKVKSQFGFENGQFYSKLGTNAHNYDGHCCFEWRQGVKHDCASVMELSLRGGDFINGQGETVCIEKNIVFPLVKSSMFKSPIIHEFSKYVIVTQKKPREETAHLQNDVPKTWEYLNRNRELFEKRKSSIYRGAPPFSLFGVGDYSYSQYKVGVSGFYKRPMFSLLYSDDGKPVMTDDTSYFICFDSYDMAYVAMLLLNSSRVQSFLSSIAFMDAKRPFTKKVLDRIDFGKIAENLLLDDLHETEDCLNLPRYVTDAMYSSFKDLSKTGQMSLI